MKVKGFGRWAWCRWATTTHRVSSRRTSPAAEPPWLLAGGFHLLVMLGLRLLLELVLHALSPFDLGATFLGRSPARVVLREARIQLFSKGHRRYSSPMPTRMASANDALDTNATPWPLSNEHHGALSRGHPSHAPGADPGPRSPEIARTGHDGRAAGRSWHAGHAPGPPSPAGHRENGRDWRR